MLSKQNIGNRVWAIYGDTNEEVARAFIRFQEYYEGEQLRGKVSLTVKDVEAWWNVARQKQQTEDSYYQYWHGFNLPGRIISELSTNTTFKMPFDSTGAHRYHSEENELIRLVNEQSIKEIRQSYYIGLAKTTDYVLDHEVAHALFATNENYKSSQLYNISRLPKIIYDMLRGDILSMGYHSSVVIDEMQAYLSTYPEVLEETFEVPEYVAHTGPFIKTFKSFKDFNRTAITIDKLRERQERQDQ